MEARNLSEEKIHMASQRQIDANRRNAQKSTGPKTPEGRAAVRSNALRHGLTAQHAVLCGEKKAEFNEALTAFQEEYQPVGPAETLLVHQIAMAAWRLQRIRGMETGVFDLRFWDLEKRMNEEYTDLDSHHRHGYVFLSDVRGANALARLSIYESRAERSFYKALHELERLQARRSGQYVPPPAAIDLDMTLSGEGPNLPEQAVSKQLSDFGIGFVCSNLDAQSPDRRPCAA
jgi:hypothetical protein